MPFSLYHEDVDSNNEWYLPIEPESSSLYIENMKLSYKIDGNPVGTYHKNPILNTGLYLPSRVSWGVCNGSRCKYDYKKQPNGCRCKWWNKFQDFHRTWIGLNSNFDQICNKNSRLRTLTTKYLRQ